MYFINIMALYILDKELDNVLLAASSSLGKNVLLSLLLSALIEEENPRNQYGLPYCLDDALVSRLLHGKKRLPLSLRKAARSFLDSKKKARRFVLFIEKSDPYFDFSAASASLDKVLRKDGDLYQKVFKALNPPDCLFRALLYLLLKSSPMGRENTRPRGRPRKEYIHPDLALLDPERQKREVVRFLHHLSRLKDPTPLDGKELLAIISLSLLPEGKKTVENSLRPFLSAPGKGGLEPALALMMEFEMALGKEKAAIWATRIEMTASKLKVETLDCLYREFLLNGNSSRLREALGKLSGTYFWRSSAPTFISLLSERGFYLNQKRDPALVKAVAPFRQ